MSNIGKNLTLSIGTLNCRGLRATKKRRAILRQCKDNVDIVLFQDTHLDEGLTKTIEKEMKGSWVFNNRANNSGGVAIYCNDKNGRMTADGNDDYSDNNGSITGKLIKIEEYNIYVISAYAPCCGNDTQKLTKNLKFLTNLEKIIMDKRSAGLEVIIAGDLNFIRDAYLDADGGEPKVYKDQNRWLDHMEDMGIVDALRFLRPDERMFSWSRTGCFRRLDYILCSKNIIQKATDTIIVPVPSSDHRLLGMKITLGRDTISGPGLWRHNDTSLKDQEYTKVISDCIEEVKKQPFNTKASQWEFCKFRIRETAIEFGKNRAKSRRKEKKQIEKAYAKALYDDNNESEITELRRHLHKIYEEEDDAIRFRTGLDVIEHGEKVTPFMFRKIEQNRKESNITMLKTIDNPQGTITKKETMEALEQHFKSVFSDKDKNRKVPDDWYEGMKKIPQELSDKLEEAITQNDITKALFKLMSEGKAPGNDGLTTSFYRFFWSDISELVVGSLKEGCENGKFSNSQRQSVIRLLEKKGKDREKINGWRPISLMNVDIKLYAKVLAEKLKQICKHIISEEQLAYVEGNDVHEGHLLMNKVLELTRTKKVSGLAGCIDFKGAFDSVRHGFIYTTLSKMGLGANFIGMIKSLYNNNISAVLNFGTTTSWIDLERSCRQGDPVSAYLFILVMEVLFNKLRKLKIGIKLGKQSIWSVAFADDLTLLVQSNQELRSALKILDEYKGISGLEINYDKSEILELNYKYDQSIGIPKADMVKITGIWFAVSYEKMVQNNWEEVCRRIAAKLQMWKGRSLSEIGKATVINAQISPMVLYVSAVVELPVETEKTLMQMTYKFIGNGGEKESRALLCKRKENGGLGVPNWRARCRSVMALWAVKSTQSNKPWTNMFSEPCINWKSQSALATIRPTHGVKGFAGSCVTEWYKTAALANSSHSAILWPYVKSHQTARMLQKKSPTLTFDQAATCLPENLNYLEKMQVKSALPEAHKTLKRQREQMAYEGRNNLQKQLNCTKWPKPRYNTKGEQQIIGAGRVDSHIKWLEEKYSHLNITTLRSLKSIYKLHIDNIIPPPHPFRNKIESEHGLINWEEVDKDKTTTYSRQQAFNWRSTHGKLYANKNFFRMNIKDSPRCTYCEEENQSVNHLFIECKVIKQLFSCFERQYKLENKLTTLEKIIGCDPNSKRPKLTMKRLGILRRMIYQCNHKDEKPKWGVFLEQMDKCYTYEYAIADRNGKIMQHLKFWEK